MTPPAGLETQWLHKGEPFRYDAACSAFSLGSCFKKKKTLVVQVKMGMQVFFVSFYYEKLNDKL